MYSKKELLDLDQKELKALQEQQEQEKKARNADESALSERHLKQQDTLKEQQQLRMTQSMRDQKKKLFQAIVNQASTEFMQFFNPKKKSFGCKFFQKNTKESQNIKIELNVNTDNNLLPAPFKIDCQNSTDATMLKNLMLLVDINPDQVKQNKNVLICGNGCDNFLKLNAQQLTHLKKIYLDYDKINQGRGPGSYYKDREREALAALKKQAKEITHEKTKASQQRSLSA